MAFDLYQYARKNGTKHRYPIKLADGTKLVLPCFPEKRNVAAITKAAAATSEDEPMKASFPAGTLGASATDKPQCQFSGEHAEHVIRQTLGKEETKEEAKEEPKLKVG